MDIEENAVIDENAVLDEDSNDIPYWISPVQHIAAINPEDLEKEYREPPLHLKELESVLLSETEKVKSLKAVIEESLVKYTSLIESGLCKAIKLQNKALMAFYRDLYYNNPATSTPYTRNMSHLIQVSNLFTSTRHDAYIPLFAKSVRTWTPLGEFVADQLNKEFDREAAKPDFKFKNRDFRLDNAPRKIAGAISHLFNNNDIEGRGECIMSSTLIRFITGTEWFNDL
jgi:hypothetical protein